MSNKIIWQQGSSNANNRENFDQIINWWGNLTGQKITFAQRLIPENNNIEEINWEEQRFDETFILKKAQIRGITLYWQKMAEDHERNLTANKLELDIHLQELYIFSQSQTQLVIRVAIPQVKYKLIDLNNPKIAAKMIGKDCILICRDEKKQMEVKITLSSSKVSQLVETLTNYQN